jgi:hypothetical protein
LLVREEVKAEAKLEESIKAHEQTEEGRDH